MQRFSVVVARSAVLAAAFALSPAAWAEADPLARLDARLGRVEAQADAAGAALNASPRDAPRGAIVTAQLFGNSQAVTQLTTRMDNVEAQMRQITGQIEQLAFQLRQIDERLRRRADGSLAPPEQRQAAAPPQQGAQTPPQAPPPQPVRPAAPQTPGAATDKPIDLGLVFDRRGAPEAAPAAVEGEAPVLPVGVAAKEAYDISYGYISRGDYALAERSFREFLTRHPQDQLSGNAQFWLGETFYNRGKFREAADAYLKVTTDFATSAKAPESLVKLGASLRQLQENETACTALSEFGRRYPRAPTSLRNQAQAESQRAGCS